MSQRDWLARSARELEAARKDLNDGFFEQACGHAYYATFYAAQQLLAVAGRKAKTHSGTAVTFTELVRELGGQPSVPALLSQLQQTREDTTYRFLEVDSTEAEQAISKAEELIVAVKELLDQLS